MAAKKPFRIAAPYYPIVYVRGYAMRASEREETFHDTYYGFSATSVEKRQAEPPRYFEADVFEGQLIRLMKLKDYGYADSVNRGLEVFHDNPSRSLWVCRFYDPDYMRESIRSIEDHAGDLYDLVCTRIPDQLKSCGVDLGPGNQDYRVILIAHSMGGLVCRTLIQNLLPAKNIDPKTIVHRLVTLGTPHRGIDLGRVPDFVENLLARANPFDANIFNKDRMRQYLRLEAKADGRHRFDLHSLGPQQGPLAFPAKRCLCIIGSDYQSYGAVKAVTGSFSDGLVKQDHAYLVGGEIPGDGAPYPEAQQCFWANVHRAHSGYRGIVNSYESYENIQRFLFGDIRAVISLENLSLPNPTDPATTYFYDFEFLVTIRKTGAYLHRREQDPCENAIRVKRAELPKRLYLHTLFMNSRLRDEGSEFAHFSAKIRVVEHRVRDGFLWDHEYPERPIYNETLEVRVGDAEAGARARVAYRWLSDGDTWLPLNVDANGMLRLPLRTAGALTGDLTIEAGRWPDPRLTQD